MSIILFLDQAKATNNLVHMMGQTLIFAHWNWLKYKTKTATKQTFL